jgi:HSP20 family protein
MEHTLICSPRKWKIIKIIMEESVMRPMIRKTNGSIPSIWEEIFGDYATEYQPEFKPAFNTLETPKNYGIEILIPGYKKENVKISVENHLLIISTKEKPETKEKIENEGVRYSHKEFSLSDFERKFGLPEDSKEEEISAKFEDGILSIFVPKENPKEEINRQIEIN